MSTNDPNTGDSIFRHVIAWTLLATSVVGLVILGCVVVVNATDKEKASTLVFNALLPVFGTWVGTLLAFYFSKENLDSATRNMNDLTRAVGGLDKLKSVPAMSKAISLASIFVPKDAAGQPETNLQAIIKALKAQGRQRFLVFKAGNAIERIVHLSLLESYISDYALNPPAAGAKALNTLTTADLFAVPKINQISAQSFATVPQTATLAEAKDAMDQKTKQLGNLGSCEDVFLTPDGTATLPIVGWITNDIISDNAKV